MKAYRVKLNDGHSANPDQVVNGYLGYNIGDARIALYDSRHVANKKAKMFGGTVEPWGKEFTVAKDRRLLQFSASEISGRILSRLIAYGGWKANFSKHIFHYGNIFDTMMEDIKTKEQSELPPAEMEELEALAALCYSADYIQILY